MTSALLLSKCDIQNLELYQIKVIRQLLHLPERVATSAIYVLSGQLPMEAEIHKRRLSLYGNIVRNDSIERELAYRQLAVKESTSKSWFVLKVIQTNCWYSDGYKLCSTCC